MQALTFHEMYIVQFSFQYLFFVRIKRSQIGRFAIFSIQCCISLQIRKMTAKSISSRKKRVINNDFKEELLKVIEGGKEDDAIQLLEVSFYFSVFSFSLSYSIILSKITIFSMSKWRSQNYP